MKVYARSWMLRLLVVLALLLPTPVAAQTGTLPTTTTLESLTGAPVATQTVILRATVTEGEAGIPTGEVIFQDGGETLGSAPLEASGQATLTISAGFHAGAHSLTATYSGDSFFSGSASIGLPLAVEKANVDLVFVSQDPSDSAVYGQMVTAQFRASAKSPGQGAAVGTVNFSNGEPPNVSSCQVTLDSAGNGGCSILARPGDPRNPSVYAGFYGNSDFNNAYATHSLTVSSASTTATITGVLPNVGVTGGSAQISATMQVNAPGSGTPSGTLTISTGSASCLASAPSGSCVLTMSAPGMQHLTVRYTPDLDSMDYFNSSVSTPYDYLVVKGATTLQITGVNPPDWAAGEDVSVHYRVSAVAPATGSPDGNVSITGAGGSCVATAAAGSCTLTTNVSGAQSFNGEYLGSDLYEASTAQPFSADNKPSGVYADPAGVCDHFNPCFTDLALAVAATKNGAVLQVYPGLYSGSLVIDRPFTVEMLDSVEITGDLLQSDGTLQAPATRLVVHGDFRQTGGVYQGRGGVLVLSPDQPAELQADDALDNLEILDMPMLGYWPLDVPPKEDPLAVVDVSGNGRHGRLLRDVAISDPAPVPFSNKESLLFYRDNSISLPVDLPETGGTISFWYLVNQADRGFFEATNGASAYDRSIYLHGNNLCASLWNNVTYEICSTGKDFTGSVYHHVVYRYGAALPGHQLIVDGEVVASDPTAPISGNVWQTSVNFAYSRQASYSSFYGKLDELRIYDHVLTDTQVADLYQFGVASSVMLQAPLRLNGSMNLYSGRLDVSVDNQPVMVKQNWQAYYGILSPRQGTVTLDGQNQNLRGISSFFNLAKVTPEGALDFECGKRVTVNGRLTLKGEAGRPLQIYCDGFYPADLTLNGTIDAQYLDINKVTAHQPGHLVNIIGTGSVRSGPAIGWNIYKPEIHVTQTTVPPQIDTQISAPVTDADDPASEYTLSLWVTALPCHGRLFQLAPGGGCGAEITAADLPARVNDPLGRLIIAETDPGMERMCSLGLRGSDGQVTIDVTLPLTFQTRFNHWLYTPLVAQK